MGYNAGSGWYNKLANLVVSMCMAKHQTQPVFCTTPAAALQQVGSLPVAMAAGSPPGPEGKQLENTRACWERQKSLRTA